MHLAIKIRSLHIVHARGSLAVPFNTTLDLLVQALRKETACQLLQSFLDKDIDCSAKFKGLARSLK